MAALAVATLAALSTGVTAFAEMDKTVRLDVDGHTVAVRTFAGDVSSAAAARVKLPRATTVTNTSKARNRSMVQAFVH